MAVFKNEAEAKAQNETNIETNDEKPKELKPVAFVRKDLRPGMYSTTIGSKRIQILDRQVYNAKTKEEIDFFKNDPEIVKHVPDTKIKK